jgi:hypothetical protein
MELGSPLAREAEFREVQRGVFDPKCRSVATPLINSRAIEGSDFAEGKEALSNLSLSTDSLQIIPSTWFTHFGIWGEPKCPGKSVNRWMSD